MAREPNLHVLLSVFWMVVMQAVMRYRSNHNRQLPRAPRRNWSADMNLILDRMFNSSDRVCHEQLRMKMGSFQRLCARLKTYGLVDSRDVRVEEQVAIFLTMVGHDHRNRVGGFMFFRSGQTVSYYFHRVLNSCLALYKDVVTNATANNSPYDKGSGREWYHYFEVGCF